MPRTMSCQHGISIHRPCPACTEAIQAEFPTWETIQIRKMLESVDLRFAEAQREREAERRQRLDAESELKRVKRGLEAAIQGLRLLCEPCTRMDYTAAALDRVVIGLAQHHLDLTLAALATKKPDLDAASEAPSVTTVLPGAQDA